MEVSPVPIHINVLCPQGRGTAHFVLGITIMALQIANVSQPIAMMSVDMIDVIFISHTAHYCSI